MQKIVMSDKDAEYFRDWQRLEDDEKEAINEIAQFLGSKDKRNSLYSLINAQAKISELLTTASHIGWLGKLFIWSGAAATVILSIIGLAKIFIGTK